MVFRPLTINTFSGLIYLLFFMGVISVEMNNLYFYTEIESEVADIASYSFSNEKAKPFYWSNHVQWQDLFIYSESGNLILAEQNSLHTDDNVPIKKHLHGPKKPPKKRKNSSSKEVKKRMKAKNSHFLHHHHSIHSEDLASIQRYLFSISEKHSPIHIPPPKFC